jgi:hypothetical protein
MIYGPKSDGTYVVGPIGFKKALLTRRDLPPGTIEGTSPRVLRSTAMNGRIAKLQEK